MNSPKPVPDEVSGTQTKPEVDLIKLEPAHETKIKPVETHKTEKADSPVSQKAVVFTPYEQREFIDQHKSVIE